MRDGRSSAKRGWRRTSERRFDAEGTELRRRSEPASFFFWRIFPSRFVVAAKKYRYYHTRHGLHALSRHLSPRRVPTPSGRYASASAHIAGRSLAAIRIAGGVRLAAGRPLLVPSPRVPGDKLAPFGLSSRRCVRVGLVSKRHRDERGEQRRDLLGGAVILEGQIRKALRGVARVPSTACPDWRDTEARTHR